MHEVAVSFAAHGARNARRGAKDLGRGDVGRFRPGQIGTLSANWYTSDEMMRDISLGGCSELTGLLCSVAKWPAISQA
jgi:hypothetical protein